MKLRVKSVANAMLGMDMGGMQRGSGTRSSSPAEQPAAPAETKDEPKKIDPVNLLRGILGR